MGRRASSAGLAAQSRNLNENTKKKKKKLTACDLFLCFTREGGGDSLFLLRTYYVVVLQLCRVFKGVLYT